MIVENQNQKQKKLNELQSTLQKQKYPKNLIENGIERALQIPQTDLRKPKARSNEKVLAFTTTFNPNNPDVFKIVKQSLDHIKTSTNIKEALDSHILINPKRQPPSLQRLLCKSEYIRPEKIKVSKCGKNCICCNYISEGTEINFKHCATPFKIRSRFDCNSSNLIYLLKCKGCNEEYIGQTGRTLKERVVLYRQHINTPEYGTIFVEKHLRTCGNKEFSISPFFQLKSNEKNNRENHEQKFISQFKPSLNRRI